MREARFPSPSDAGILPGLRQVEVLVIFKEPEAHEYRREHRLGPPEIVEEIRAVWVVPHEEVVQAGVVIQHPCLKSSRRVASWFIT